MEGGYLTEIPSYLKQLARLIARGFFQIEDSLVVDMLVRNSCMKEKELEELLKFDAKLLRARLATLKNEKFVQTRLRMETGADGKAQKVNYYFINYKSLVNVIKYKLDHMRKKMETQERDATNRASFKCTSCSKSFTDLEVGELFDPVTELLYCTFCKQVVEEDESSSVPKDSRLMLAKFNEQMEQLFELLRKAEHIKLAPELLDPEPPKGYDSGKSGSSSKNDRPGTWSGELTRSSGSNDHTRIDVLIGDESLNKPLEEKKERPIWLMESTISNINFDYGTDSSHSKPSASAENSSEKSASKEEIMNALLTFEKRGSTKAVIPDNDSDSDVMEDPDQMSIPNELYLGGANEVEQMDDDDDDESIPTVTVGDEKYPVHQVPPEAVERMTASEKETYVRLFQEYNPYD